MSIHLQTLVPPLTSNHLSVLMTFLQQQAWKQQIILIFSNYSIFLGSRSQCCLMKPDLATQCSASSYLTSPLPEKSLCQAKTAMK